MNPRHNGECGGFPASVGAKNAIGLSFYDLKIQVPDGSYIFIGFG